jgi:hypothetical protein
MLIKIVHDTCNANVGPPHLIENNRDQSDSCLYQPLPQQVNIKLLTGIRVAECRRVRRRQCPEERRVLVAVVHLVHPEQIAVTKHDERLRLRYCGGM